jgi:hypothetical protein
MFVHARRRNSDYRTFLKPARSRRYSALNKAARRRDVRLTAVTSASAGRGGGRGQGGPPGADRGAPYLIDAIDPRLASQRGLVELCRFQPGLEKSVPTAWAEPQAELAPLLVLTEIPPDLTGVTALTLGHFDPPFQFSGLYQCREARERTKGPP